MKKKSFKKLPCIVEFSLKYKNPELQNSQTMGRIEYSLDERNSIYSMITQIFVSRVGCVHQKQWKFFFMIFDTVKRTKVVLQFEFEFKISL